MDGEGSRDIAITVSDPQKRGDGMSSFIVYKVSTKTSLSWFRSGEFFVLRRFSDFLGIYEKLCAKYAPDGYFVPPAPGKDVFGTTKVKMSKDEQATNSSDFLEKRRAALERYMNRTAQHPNLRQDPDFHDFLQAEELPRATSTRAISGQNMWKAIEKLGDSVNKMTFKMDEQDQVLLLSKLWFEEKRAFVDQLETQLVKLHMSVEQLAMHRKDLTNATGGLAKSCGMLAAAEDHEGLSSAISRLSETEGAIEKALKDQADADYFNFSELLKDYVGQLHSVKAALTERVKCFKVWKDAEQALQKKRENKVKLELAHKQDKIPAAEKEIADCEEKVEEGRKKFNAVSDTIKKEYSRFNEDRVRDCRKMVLNYLEQLAETQKTIIAKWEAFIPVTEQIA